MKPPMVGWIVFAATMLMVVGTLDFFEGLIAIARDDYYVLTPSQIVVFDTTAWGWITMLWGVLLVLAGFALWAGSGFARWLAVVLACGNIIAQLGWLGSSAYPLWTIVIISLNIIVVYALTARWEGFVQRPA